MLKNSRWREGKFIRITRQILSAYSENRLPEKQTLVNTSRSLNPLTCCVEISDLHFVSPQPDISLHYETTDSGLLHRAVCLCTSQLSLVLIASIHGRTVRLSWPEMVNHPSSNRARRRLTLLMRTATLPTVKPPPVVRVISWQRITAAHDVNRHVRSRHRDDDERQRDVVGAGHWRVSGTESWQTIPQHGRVGGARDRLLRHLPDRHRRQRVHVCCDRAQQTHAHRNQLLPFLARRFRSTHPHTRSVGWITDISVEIFYNVYNNGFHGMYLCFIVWTIIVAICTYVLLCTHGLCYFAFMDCFIVI